ncbi:hypothetical protein mRhiFer1_008074 [Rhinolophus ferrumequinum]|uniref:Uncharacterized protein n=1 Tax=Rhinolophus ferrumequinum TaxID=59479 RepID=A0A7J7WRI8_RHIFE|nr:hypothetical protein mRhiFer1_008074 [Rhinolophus ferrumequinum]
MVQGGLTSGLLQLFRYEVTKARDRAVAERWKCGGKSERLQRSGVHFSAPLLLPPWSRPPSSLAWLTAPPPNLCPSLTCLLPSSVSTVTTCGRPVQLLPPHSGLAQHLRLWDLQRLHCGARCLWLHPLWGADVFPPRHKAVILAILQTHHTCSCLRELTCACFSPKQRRANSFTSFRSLLQCHLISDIFLDHPSDNSDPSLSSSSLSPSPRLAVPCFMPSDMISLFVHHLISPLGR